MSLALHTQKAAAPVSASPQNYYGNIFEGFSRLPQSIQLWIKTMDEMSGRENGLIKYFKESDPRSVEGQRKKKERDREYFWLIFLMAMAFSEQENQVLIAIQQIRNQIKQRVEAIDMKIDMTQHIIEEHAKTPSEKRTLRNFMAKLREMRDSYTKYQEEELDPLQQDIVQARQTGTPISPEILETSQNQIEDRFEQMDNQIKEQERRAYRSGFRLSDLWAGHAFSSSAPSAKAGNDNEKSNDDAIAEQDEEVEVSTQAEDSSDQKPASKPDKEDDENEPEPS